MKQLVIHTENQITQAALLRNDELIDYIIEPISNRSLVGNVYRGIVQNVLPGMQAAFVNIGLTKNAFIYVDDLLHPNQDKQPEKKPSVSALVKQGDTILVQVIKDPQGNKGARVTTHINLAGRWLVFLPTADYVGISRKVTQDSERERLKMIASSLVNEDEGIIFRTAASGEDGSSLMRDVERLRELWNTILMRYQETKGPSLLHTEIHLIERLFRDIYTDDIDEIWVSSKMLQDEVISLLERVTTKPIQHVHCYLQPVKKLITQFSVNRKVLEAYSEKIQLKSGGYLVWEETEALTVVDVNTGKFVGHTNLEDTLLQTNSEAAELIARLLRIRDVGGIIIIDFIDMESEENKSTIYRLLQHYLLEDGQKSTVFGWTRLGLMEMTRKKTRDRITEKYLLEYELR